MSTKILVVDDDPNIGELLRIYFENEGYEVKTAADGAEGVSFFKMYEPDLVLLDVMLPKKDGWQVLREIREVSSKPVIMVTAKGDVFDKVLGLELGADDFVVKPFDMKELSARIKAVLRRYSAHDNQLDDEVIKFDRNMSLSFAESPLTFLPRSWSCCISWRPILTESLQEISFWTRYGALTIWAIRERLTYM